MTLDEKLIYSHTKGIYEIGVRHGREEGLVLSIRKLMKNLNISFEEACKMLGEEERFFELQDLDGHLEE